MAAVARIGVEIRIAAAATAASERYGRGRSGGAKAAAAPAIIQKAYAQAGASSGCPNTAEIRNAPSAAASAPVGKGVGFGGRLATQSPRPDIHNSAPKQTKPTTPNSARICRKLLCAFCRM